MRTKEQQLRSIRILIGIVIAGLIASGLSAFPLLRESARLDHYAHQFGFPPFVPEWTAHVHEGLKATYAAYPFVGYGTDRLAFGHFVVAIFLFGALVDPVRNIWVIRASMIACTLVVPTALICGAVRGIPLWWRAIDSSFGIVGLIPLWLAARMIRRLRG
jgi:hypothetical protein